MLREERYKALPARFTKTIIWTPSGDDDSIESASKERINTRRIVRLYGVEFCVEFGERHIRSLKRFALEIGIALCGYSVHHNLVRRFNGLINGRQQRNNEARDTADLRTCSKPTAKGSAPGKPGHDSQQQAKTTPQPGVQIVTDRVALGIKPGFIKGSLIGLWRGVWHFLFLSRGLGVPAFGPVMALGYVFPVRRTCFSPAGWLMWISILADVNADVLGMTAGRDRHPNYIHKEIT